MKISGEFIPDGMNSFERNVKRVGDCIIASILMMLFSPLFLVCYIAVKREDGGPVIFKQERIGRFGRPFYIYKFRSMRLCANIILTNYLNFGMFFVEICLLSDLVLNVNFILTKLWNETLAIGFCIRFVLG